jgi:hypothetical protein
VRLLVSDYAAGHADGPGAEEWLRRMEESVGKLTKRLGGDRVAQVTQALRRRDFESVARSMLMYYDTLYDRHLANQGGTGSGSGTRPGLLADVATEGEDAEFDADAFAGLVLEAVARAEAGGVGGVDGGEKVAARRSKFSAGAGMLVSTMPGWGPGGALVLAAAVLAVGLAGVRIASIGRRLA